MLSNIQGVSFKVPLDFKVFWNSEALSYLGSGPDPPDGLFLKNFGWFSQRQQPILKTRFSLFPPLHPKYRTDAWSPVNLGVRSGERGLMFTEGAMTAEWGAWEPMPEERGWGRKAR